MAYKRYNISIDNDLANEMDRFMEKYHTNRSSLISVAVTQYMYAMEKLPKIEEQLENIKKIIDVK